MEGTSFSQAWETLCDDINVPRCLGEIFTAFAKAKEKPLNEADIDALGAILYALGLKIFEEKQEEKIDAPKEILEMANARWEAKKAKNWAEADRIRDELKARGIEIIDTPQGAKWRRV